MKKSYWVMLCYGGGTIRLDYKSDNNSKAICDAIRWVSHKLNCGSIGIKEITEILIGEFAIEEIDGNGFCNSRRGKEFFSWWRLNSNVTLQDLIETYLR